MRAAGKHKRLYGMLLKAFSTRVKTAIETNLSETVAHSGPLLEQKLTEKTRELDVEALLSKAMKAKQEKAVRLLFATLNSKGNGRWVVADIVSMLELMDELGLELGTAALKELATPALEELGGDAASGELSQEHFIEWWLTKSADKDSGPVAAMVDACMGLPSDSGTPLGGVLMATRLRMGMPDPK
jgi:hypothetical protein